MIYQRFFQPKGKEHEDDIGDMCVENGCGVKHQTALYPLTDSIIPDPFCKVTVVYQHIGEACKKIYKIGQQQVDNQCYRRGEC